MDQQEQRTFYGRTEEGFSSSTPAAPIVDANSRLAFLRRVYGWMFAGIVSTVLGAGIAVKSGFAESMLQWGTFSRILFVLAWVGGAYGVQALRHTRTWNVVAFALYGAFTGVVISTLVLLAMVLAKAHGEHASFYLLQAGGLTLVAFGALSAYAFFTKRDFSFLRGFLTVGLFVLLGAIVIGLFLESTALQIAISAGGILLFSGFVLYDTQKVLKTYPDGEHVAGAMTLFIDFVMLFIYILRFILIIAGGGRRD